MKKNILALALFAAFFLSVFPHSSFAWKPGVTVFERTGSNISFMFKNFMRANEENAPQEFWRLVPGSQSYLFDNATALFLQKYYFVLIPGGEFDAASELIKYCDNGSLSLDLENFFEKNPTTRDDVEAFLHEYICARPDMVNTLYTTYLGTFKAYESFFASQGLPFTRLDYFAPAGPSHIGDRIGKLDLIANAIEALEAQSSSDSGTQARGYILIGHSFGGLNICDFLVELAGGHAPGTPEWKFFARTIVRSWSAQKKEKIFNKIKAAVLLNSFIQGNHSNEQRLLRIAEQEGNAGADPVEQYILDVLEKSQSGEITTEELIADEKTHLALITARYRKSYYLTGNNVPARDKAFSVQQAFGRIAAGIPVISAGGIVPKYGPYRKVGINLLVYKSTYKWDDENIPNDGAVDTYGGIFPGVQAEYLVLNDMDHGTLTMKPEIPWVTAGSRYNQIPFIKTLLKHLEARIKLYDRP